MSITITSTKISTGSNFSYVIINNSKALNTAYQSRNIDLTIWPNCSRVQKIIAMDNSVFNKTNIIFSTQVYICIEH